MVVLALVSDPPVVAKILRHLGLPVGPPAIAPAPARREEDADLPAWFPGLDEPVEVAGDEGDGWVGEPARGPCGSRRGGPAVGEGPSRARPFPLPGATCRQPPIAGGFRFA